MYRSALAIPLPASKMMSYSRVWTSTETVLPVGVSNHPLVPRKVTCIWKVLVFFIKKGALHVFNQGVNENVNIAIRLKKIKSGFD